MSRKLAYGEPPDVVGACNARLRLADNFSDGAGTFVCRLLPDHVGLHEERLERGDGPVIVQWTTDEGKEYSDCYCACGWEDMGEATECLHKWPRGKDECRKCGMTRAEHEAIIEYRKRDEEE
jgi:hypothetical protein